jgi:hypothetical protein
MIHALYQLLGWHDQDAIAALVVWLCILSIIVIIHTFDIARKYDR